MMNTIRFQILLRYRTAIRTFLTGQTGFLQLKFFLHLRHYPKCTRGIWASAL